tara:strand:+ start:249 stop:485 length:237 start_codon:yes stop_codon:yes gene_type:complete
MATAPNGEEIIIPTDTWENRKAWFEGAGAPVKPEGYDSMAEDNPAKVSYDSSVTENASQIAECQAKIDAGETNIADGS